ncbi:MAG: hypothetical protein COV74_02270 [Candidatus Omnitrophica bacterium CG11_big_fil_rev_8_21_14_0_20_45_26]|uniref:dTDP-4-dehydrorhamnose reductase n=1 Tax=Candidatus Abzuiibacterium crystallinum TaxID=1974748 RepID=A0A2H0LRC1_9BACT|nr:MAG: hypothetical protein COV74_02270 [Candidatus Omnitrophica bacterium CG11_big_fil_rev_8_21_14_0_20_45_26]PIW64564.1 MAG: hypothetical protein COW12_05595 [Candidatus Omnitrophica bacterium CG12_big_fil_rev_8_21_14_0_65_45_16]
MKKTLPSKERILITGLNALTGWHLYQTASRAHNVIGTYRKKHPLLKGRAFHRIDLDNQDEVSAFISRIKPTVIIHARSICDLDVCEETPWLAEKINIEGTKKIIQAARALPQLKKFVFMSTDHVFDGTAGRYHELSPPKPKHVFGRTKREAEKMVSSSALPHLIIRPGLVLGDSLQGTIGPQDFLLSRLKKGKPTTLFTDEWRTPIPAAVLAEKVLELALSKATGIFHVAGSRVQNRYEIGRQLAEEHALPKRFIIPRRRAEDAWAHIRPEHLTLISLK